MNSKLIHFLIVAFMLVMVSCNSNPDMEVAASSTADHSAEGLYELSKTQFESSDMKLGKIEMHDFHEVIKANGMFDVPPESRASVSSYFGGTVKNIRLLTGEPVKRGQILFTLENPDFVQIQQDFLEAKGQLAYLKSDYERQKNLAEDNVSSQKNFLKAESEYTVTKVRVESLSKKLTLMNIDPNTLTIENIRAVFNVLSPINGYITEVDITRGEFLNPAETAVSIINTDHLHLELNIFEKDLATVSIGQSIKFRIQEDKRREYLATVHLINKTVDPASRTIGIHGHLSETEVSSNFTPGMYIEADIYTASESKASLPQNALVEVDGKYYTLMLDSQADNSFSFIKKEVRIGSSDNEFIEILNSREFSDNTTFLTRGAFNLIKE